MVIFFVHILVEKAIQALQTKREIELKEEYVIFPKKIHITFLEEIVLQ